MASPCPICRRRSAARSARKITQTAPAAPTASASAIRAVVIWRSRVQPKPAAITGVRVKDRRGRDRLCRLQPFEHQDEIDRQQTAQNKITPGRAPGRPRQARGSQRHRPHQGCLPGRNAPLSALPVRYAVPPSTPAKTTPPPAPKKPASPDARVAPRSGSTVFTQPWAAFFR